jgi:predicted tellurium resistance membrane protein TerC
MTTSVTSPDDRIERIRRIISLIGFCAIAVTLAGGLVLSLAGQPAASRQVYTVAAGLLLAMPISGVVAALLEEVIRRDWWFAAAALGVLLLIGYRLLELVA